MQCFRASEFLLFVEKLSYMQLQRKHNQQKDLSGKSIKVIIG